MTLHRPSDLLSVRTTGIPIFNITLSSMFGSLRPDIVHSCFDQLTAFKAVYPLTNIAWPYRGFKYRHTEFECFLKLSTDKLPLFSWSQAQVQFFYNACLLSRPCLKASRNVLTANTKKTFGRKFFMILAVKESSERFSCFEFILKNCKHREAGLKHHIKLIAHKWGHLLFSDRYMECMLHSVRKGITFHHHK